MRTLAVSVCWVCAVVVSANAAAARDYFVAPDGADAAGDGSVARPFATIDRALSSAAAGDRVVLRGGEYRLAEMQRFPRGGEPGRPITLTAYQDEYAALLGSARLTGWEPHEGNVWKCKAPERPIKGLYEDSERLVHPRQRGVRENPPAAAVALPGRWTVDGQWVYLWTREGDSPDRHRIEASQHDVIVLNRPWLRVEKLHVLFGQPTGLVISADHCEATDCEVAHVANSVDNAYAAYISHCSNSALRRCRVHDSYYWGDHGSNSHLVSCIDCGDDGPNFVDACETFNGGLGVGTKGAAREMVVTNCRIRDAVRGLVVSGERSSGPGAGKTDRGHYVVWHNRFDDCGTGVYFSSGKTHENLVAGNLFRRCGRGIDLRMNGGVPDRPAIVNNVFLDCGEAVFLAGDYQGGETLSRFAAGGFASHHNLFFGNTVDWRNPLTWTANLDRSCAEMQKYKDFGWGTGSIAADPLIDPAGGARENSPTLGAGAPLDLPPYIEKPQRCDIGLGPGGLPDEPNARRLALSVVGPQQPIGPGDEVKLQVVLTNADPGKPVQLVGDCIVTVHFRYRNVWYFDRQEIWRQRLSLPARTLGPGQSIELSALDGWRDPVNGRPGDAFHLRADDQLWKAGCRLAATVRFVRPDEPTAEALQRLEPLVRSTEVHNVELK